MTCLCDDVSCLQRDVCNHAYSTSSSSSSAIIHTYLRFVLRGFGNELFVYLTYLSVRIGFMG